MKGVVIELKVFFQELYYLLTTMCSDKLLYRKCFLRRTLVGVRVFSGSIRWGRGRVRVKVRGVRVFSGSIRWGRVRVKVRGVRVSSGSIRWGRKRTKN